MQGKGAEGGARVIAGNSAKDSHLPHGLPGLVPSPRGEGVLALHGGGGGQGGRLTALILTHL